MSTKPRAIEKFDPTTDWARDELADIYLIYLPDFRKEQVRVQLTPTQVLRISGERPIGNIKWKSFLKEVKLPDNCDFKDISARFEGGILKIKMPKVITPATPSEHTRQVIENLTSPDKPGSTLQAPTNAWPHGPVTQNTTGIEQESRGLNKHDERKEPVKRKSDDGERKKGVHEASKSKQMKKRDMVGGSESRQAERSGVILQQLMKPENFKKVVVVVLLVLVLVLHNAYVKRVCRGMEHPDPIILLCHEQKPSTE